MKIPFTNLYQQYLDCQSEIDSAIKTTIESSSFITGLDVTKFENVMAEYVGAEDCASTGSCTTALICSLKAASIGPGDQVLTTPHTFVATTEAIAIVGADPVFVDIDPDTHLIDLDLLERSITDRSRAVLFVDIYGQCPDLDRLRKICDKHNMILIQDAAHSLGASWQGTRLGSQADYTCFSFNPVKNLGAMGDAGCVTGSKHNMDRVRIYRDHGRTSRYEFTELGYNARIDNMQSNIVLAKLPQLQHWISRKQSIAAYYDQQLQHLVNYVYVIQTPQRDQLKEFLESRGIGTNIHYATTTHVQPAFSQWYQPCPVAEKTVKEILSLPCRYDLTDQEVECVVATIKEFFQ